MDRKNQFNVIMSKRESERHSRLPLDSLRQADSASALVQLISELELARILLSSRTLVASTFFIEGQDAAACLGTSERTLPRRGLLDNRPGRLS
jgi:hypothetical protein